MIPKSRLLLTLATVMGAGFGLGCQTMQTTTGLAEADRNAIRQLDDTFVKAANTRDDKGGAAIYASDAIVLAPGKPPIEGRVAIEAFLSSFPPFTDYKLQVLEVEGQGPWAYERGTASMTLTPPGAPPTPMRMRFLLILRKQPDGAWKVVREIMSPDAAPPAPGEPASSGP